MWLLSLDAALTPPPPPPHQASQFWMLHSIHAYIRTSHAQAAVGPWYMVHCNQLFCFLPSLRHYPVGVLYDLFGRGGRLPWNITVHFKVSCYSIIISPSRWYRDIKAVSSVSGFIISSLKVFFRFQGRGFIQGGGIFRAEVPLLVTCSTCIGNYYS